MRFQSRKGSCGPASLSNGLACVGIQRSEDELITSTGHTADGTGVNQLRRALASVGSTEPGIINLVFREGDGARALAGLHYWLVARGRPLILCVDNYEHWVVCGGYLGSRYIIIDSSHNDLVLYYTESHLVDRWRSKDNKFYGLVI